MASQVYPLCQRDAANPVLAHKQNDQKAIGAPTAFIAGDGTLRVAYHWWKADFAASYPIILVPKGTKLTY